MHFDNVNLTRPCRLVSRNARKMGTTHGRTQQTTQGTVRQMFSPSFACDFHGRKRDKFYICSQALLIIYHEVKGGGGGGERRRFGGSHGFHCCQRVYRRDFELTTKKGGGGGVIRMLQNFMGDQVNFNDTTKILQPSPGDKY